MTLNFKGLSVIFDARNLALKGLILPICRHLEIQLMGMLKKSVIWNSSVDLSKGVQKLRELLKKAC